MSRPRIIALISGFGSNLQALIDATQTGDLVADIVLVVSNRKNAHGLTRAQDASIPTSVRTLKSYTDVGKSRTEYDTDLAAYLLDSKPDLIVLAGWMHVLGPDFLAAFPSGSVINLHPALPGAFDGVNAIGRALDAFKKGTVSNTGVMVHRVIPEVDRGEPLLVREVPIYRTDELKDLEDRIHAVEHELIVSGTKKALDLLRKMTTLIPHMK